MFYQILLVLEVIIAVLVVGLVLIQQGKGADAGAAFGSGASGTVFGASGAGSFLTRITSLFAFLFMLNSLGLAYFIAHNQNPRVENVESVIDKVGEATSVNPSDVPLSDVPVEGDPSATTESMGDVPTENPADVPGSSVIEGLKDSAIETKDALTEKVEAGKEAVNNTVESATDAAQDKANAVVEGLTEKANDTAEAVKKTVPADVPQ